MTAAKPGGNGRIVAGSVLLFFRYWRLRKRAVRQSGRTDGHCSAVQEIAARDGAIHAKFTVALRIGLVRQLRAPERRDTPGLLRYPCTPLQPRRNLQWRFGQMACGGF